MVLICSTVMLRFFQRLREAMDERESCVSADCSGREGKAHCPRASAGQSLDLPHEELSELAELDFTRLFAEEHTEPPHS